MVKKNQNKIREEKLSIYSAYLDHVTAQEANAASMGSEEDKAVYTKKVEFYKHLAGEIEDMFFSQHFNNVEGKQVEYSQNFAGSVFHAGVWETLALTNAILAAINGDKNASIAQYILSGVCFGMGFLKALKVYKFHKNLDNLKDGTAELLDEWRMLKCYPKYIDDFIAVNGLTKGPYANVKYGLPEFENKRIVRLKSPLDAWNCIEVKAEMADANSLQTEG